jgi:hypothetical protein
LIIIIMQYPPTSRHFIPFQSKLSPQHPFSSTFGFRKVKVKLSLCLTN